MEMPTAAVTNTKIMTKGSTVKPWTPDGVFEHIIALTKRLSMLSYRGYLRY